ncbi:MAG: glycosyltransferase [Acidimicrobiia bacterium]|nr:glycosyltransferase [Acidimicrobiia bacterium]
MTPTTTSLIIPVYLNEEGIPALIEAVRALNSEIPGLDVVFVVDGSPDNSLDELRSRLPAEEFHWTLASHSRNFGSFAAVRTGMALAEGSLLAVMSADLQEPPELVVSLIDELRNDTADIAFGRRMGRTDPGASKASAGLFWKMYRRFVIPDMPVGGVDIFACNATVKQAILGLHENASSLVAQLFWVGFRRAFIDYERREREIGTSAWTLKKKLRYMADSIFSFSDLPIVALTWVGLAGLVFSILLSGVTLGAQIAGLIDVPGYTTLIIATLFLFSVMLFSQGILGMYLWRTFENTRQRPLSIVASIWDSQPSKESPND